MATDGNESLVKVSKKYECLKCNYVTSRKYNLELHNNSIKHKNTVESTNGNEKLVKVSKNHTCLLCDKTFSDRTGLWKHKNKCNSVSKCNVEENNTIVMPETKYSDIANKDELILMLIKQNAELVKETSEFKNMMMKVIENGTHNTTHTNSHNKAFNLNFFLNETCKNAMNITDFVESIQYQLSDFEKLSEIGYVAGISDLIVKNLNALDITKRPVHCTDKKRETIYIKDQDKWEKDDDNNSKIRKVIKKVAFKNARLINKFTEKYPDFREYNSKYSTQYHKLIIESFGDSHGNEAEKEDKIIRNITKNVLIDK